MLLLVDQISCLSEIDGNNVPCDSVHTIKCTHVSVFDKDV